MELAYDNPTSVAEIVFGPNSNESYSTHWSYDKYGNLSRESTKCSQGGIVSLANHKYVYGDKRQIKKETFIQYKPYFQYLVREYTKKSTVEIAYDNREDEIEGRFGTKYIKRFKSTGKIDSSYTIDNKQDALDRDIYLYFPLGDTAKVRSNLEVYFGLNPKLSKFEVTYLDSFQNETIIDYYDSIEYKGSDIKTYDSKARIILEKYYSKPKDRITSQIKYAHDNKGKLVRKEDEDIDD